MIPTVAADQVPFLNDPGNQFGIFLSLAADNEERCLYVILLQTVQHLGSHEFIRAVIKGQRDTAPVIRTFAEGLDVNSAVNV